MVHHAHAPAPDTTRCVGPCPCPCPGAAHSLHFVQSNENMHLRFFPSPLPSLGAVGWTTAAPTPLPPSCLPPLFCTYGANRAQSNPDRDRDLNGPSDFTGQSDRSGQGEPDPGQGNTDNPGLGPC